MAEMRARQWRKVAYARSGELYDVYGIRTSRVSIGRPPSLDRHDAQWSGNDFDAGRALVLNNIPRFWRVDSMANWASQFGALKLVAVDYENSRAIVEFRDSKCAKAAYESEPIGSCTNLYACYCEPLREPLAPVLPPTNEHSEAATPVTPLNGGSWLDDKGLFPPLSPTLTEAYSETADMEISMLTSKQTFSPAANNSNHSTSCCPSEGCARGMGSDPNGVLGSRCSSNGDRAPSPTCTEGYSDDEDRSLPTPAYRLSCQIERKLQRQATLAEVKSFSLEVETILRGIEDSYRCKSSNFQEPPITKAHDKDKAKVSAHVSSTTPATLPDMTLQVDLERPAYIQRIGNQLKNLLDIYDVVGTHSTQGTQLLESMRTIKRELDALDEEDRAFEKHETWLASRTMSLWTRHRYPFAGWTVPLGNACTGPIEID